MFDNNDLIDPPVFLDTLIDTISHKEDALIFAAVAAPLIEEAYDAMAKGTVSSDLFWFMKKLARNYTHYHQLVEDAR